MERTPDLIVKTGEEGVFGAVFLSRRRVGAEN